MIQLSPDLIRSIQSILNYGKQAFLFVKSSWKWIFIGILAGSVILFLYTKSQPTTWTARCTFMVNEQGGSSSSFSSILNNLGMGENRSVSLPKILEISKSRKVVEKALLHKVSLHGKEDLLANHFKEIYKIKGKVDPNPLNNKSIEYQQLIKKMHRLIVGSPSSPGLLIANASPQTGILTFSVTTIDEALTLHLIKAIYDETSDYYVESAIQRQQITYNLLKSKRDSIEALLRAKEAGLANFQDRNRNVILYSVALPKERFSKEIMGLNTMYLETVKNLELADFALKNQTPFIQPLDLPVSPLDPIYPPLKYRVALGAILGGTLVLAFLFLRQLWKQVQTAV